MKGRRTYTNELIHIFDHLLIPWMMLVSVKPSKDKTKDLLVTDMHRKFASYFGIKLTSAINQLVYNLFENSKTEIQRNLFRNILNRMKSQQGVVTIKTAPGKGLHVHLRLPSEA